MTGQRPAPRRVTGDFAASDLGAPWQHWHTGAGALDLSDGTLRCRLDVASQHVYSDAQITDYAPRQRRFAWRPPVRLTVTAQASHSVRDLKGTGGFGFWNEPFVPVGMRLPRLPRAAWFFFGAPPHDMALARDVPGWGWKAATLDAARWSFVALAPLTPLGFALMRVPALYRRLWPVGQRAIGVSEAVLPVDLADRHTYTLEWLPDTVRFAVDGQRVHTAPTAPGGPLGFIAWMDNQYAVVTPQGRFRFGLVATDAPQWLAFDQIIIEST
jgi:hypothetical protein